ncbi:alpha/beta hydrolase [Nocardioides endophyticus]
MNAILTDDGTEIFYKDWGTGRPVVLSHGWPLHSDSWEAQQRQLAEAGHRVIAHDRRGHGRSTQTWDGNDMDTYADDLACLLTTLDLYEVTLVGFSTGGGEVVRYLSRHGSERVRKLVLVSAVPPMMLRTDDNPDGLPVGVFDDLRAGEGRIQSVVATGLILEEVAGHAWCAVDGGAAEDDRAGVSAGVVAGPDRFDDR